MGRAGDVFKLFESLLGADIRQVRSYLRLSLRDEPGGAFRDMRGMARRSRSANPRGRGERPPRAENGTVERHCAFVLLLGKPCGRSPLYSPEKRRSQLGRSPRGDPRSQSGDLGYFLAILAAVSTSHCHHCAHACLFLPRNQFCGVHSPLREVDRLFVRIEPIWTSSVDISSD